jgi:hypothetical protein
MTEEEDETAASLPETVIALKTGLPVQVQRGFWKAVARVFPASAEIPAAWFEGKARVIRARHEAEIAELRTKSLIEVESGKAAARQFRKPEPGLVQRALDYHAAHIVREQENREAVLRIAADELRNNPPASEPSGEVEDDWLTILLGAGSNRSSEEFRFLFGRILAGEIKQPGTFSIGTIQSLSRLNQNIANIFQKACNISSLHPGTYLPKIISDPFGDVGESAMRIFGLDYNNLSELIEAGLLRHDLREWRELPDAYYKHFPFDHAGQTFWFSSEPTDASPPLLRLTGPTFSHARAELRRVVDMDLSEQYIAGLAKWLKSMNIQLFRGVKISGDQLRGEVVEPVVDK